MITQPDRHDSRRVHREYLKRVLQKLGLLNFAVHLRERQLARGLPGDERAAGPDLLPVPPALLRLRVAGTADRRWFLEGGAKAAHGIRDLLLAHDAAPESMGALLDFGCGCGRVLRWWAGAEGVHGCDVGAEAVAWCKRNLPFAEVAVNRPAPPLPYADAKFGFIYALSVFTHFARNQQHAWMRELNRVLKPGGLLLITTHGAACIEQLSDAERAGFAGGNLVVRWESTAGSNLCSAFHPMAYVRSAFSARFEIVDIREAGAPGNPPQDAILLRKSADLCARQPDTSRCA